MAARKHSKPTAAYNRISERLRHVTPANVQCSLFCGGKNCKYESGSQWKQEEMAIVGIFSHWITSDILAMARPNTRNIERFNIIEQFHRHGIQSVINLQKPGEHASCGSALDEESGFSYKPQEFMDKNVYFYNFGWPDYGTASLPTILDMVRVMSFALKEGKVAIHCHAGLGRTGVLIACHLIYGERMTADAAVNFVRAKRDNSIQTRGQITCIRQFEEHVDPLWVVFPTICKKKYRFTLSQHLDRQRRILHGYEARRLKNIPKIIFMTCERLMTLATCEHIDFDKLSHHHEISVLKKTAKHAFYKENGQSGKVSENASSEAAVEYEESGDEDIQIEAEAARQMTETPNQGNMPLLKPSGTPLTRKKSDSQAQETAINKRKRRKYGSLRSSRSDGTSCSSVDSMAMLGRLTHDTAAIEDVARALLGRGHTLSDSQKEHIQNLKQLINDTSSGWKLLAEENDLHVIASLLWDWLENLQEAVFTYKDLKTLAEFENDATAGLSGLQQGTRHTFEYLCGIIARMQPLPSDLNNDLAMRLLSSLSLHSLPAFTDNPSMCDHRGPLNFETTQSLLNFIHELSAILEKNSVLLQLEKLSTKAEDEFEET